MTLEAAIQRAAADAKQLRGRHAVAVDLAEHFENVLPLDLLERRGTVAGARRGPRPRPWARSVRVRRLAALGTKPAGELALRQERAVDEDTRAPDDVLQLADVAVPARAVHQARGSGCQ